MPAKLERCVREVEEKGGVDNAWAVCQAALKRNPSHPRYTSAKFEGYPESEFERVMDTGYNFRGKTTTVPRGFPVIVIRKAGRRVLVRVEFYGTPLYGWMDLEDVVTESAFKKLYGYEPTKVSKSQNPANENNISKRKLQNYIRITEETIKNRENELLHLESYRYKSYEPKPDQYYLEIVKNKLKRARMDLAYYQGLLESRNQVSSEHKINPADTSAAMYESFHGKPSTETVEVEEQEHYHANLAELGTLVEMGVRTVTGLEVWLGFEGGEGESGSAGNPSIYGDQDGTWAVVYDFKPGQWGEYKRFNSKRKAQETISLMNRARGTSYSYHLVEVPVGAPSYYYKGVRPVPYSEAKTNPMWPFGPGQLLGSREYVHHVGGKGPRTHTSKSATSAVYKGYRIVKSQFGYVIPEIDPESSWDSMKIARKVVDEHAKRNPHEPAAGTPQARIKTLLEQSGIPYKEIKVFGSQILVTAWSEDAAHKWASLIRRFAKVRGPVKTVDTNLENRGTVLRPTTHVVWRIGGYITDKNPRSHGPISSATKFGGELIGDLDSRLGKVLGFSGNPSEFVPILPASSKQFATDLVNEFDKRGVYAIMKPNHGRQSGTWMVLVHPDQVEKANQEYSHAIYSVQHKRNPDNYDARWKELYDKAVAADDAFHAAVVAEFGKKRAPDMRYRSDLHTPYIQQLAKAKHKADEELHAYMELGRKHNPSNPSPDAISTSTVLLCSNESGTQLFFVGGDQSLSLPDLKFSDAEQSKESIVIGECFFISYFTQKEFDNFEPIVYEHDLGEETGVMPMLVYDRVNQRLSLAGGEYHIEQPLLETSPGIEN